METKPIIPLEANCCTWKEGAWPRWECQNARECIEETTAAVVATKTRAIGGRQRLSIGNIHPTTNPNLLPCPRIVHIIPRVIKNKSDFQVQLISPQKTNYRIGYAHGRL